MTRLLLTCGSPFRHGKSLQRFGNSNSTGHKLHAVPVERVEYFAEMVNGSGYAVIREI